MKLSSIRIQGMHNVSDKTYPLNRMNYFLGPNGAGKSTIMQAVQLALLGYIPGTDKKKSAIFSHSNGYFMSVELVLDGESGKIVITRTWSRKGKDIVATVNTIPEDVDIDAIIGELALPILNFNEFIGMTSNKLKDWFINFLPSEGSDIDWDTTLRKEIEAYGKLWSPEFVTEMIEYVKNLNSTGLERIREFNAYLKQHQSFKKAELTRVQGTIQSLIYYEGCDTSTSVDDLEELSRVDALLKDSINQQLLCISHNNNIQSQLDQLTEVTCESLEADPRYIANVESIAAMDSIIETCTTSISADSDAMKYAQHQIADKRLVIDGAGICPYSGGTCESIIKLINTFKTEIDTLEIEIEAYKNRIASKNEELATAKQKRSTYENQNAILVSQYKQSEVLKKQLYSNVSKLDEVQLRQSLQDLTKGIADRNDLIIKIKANEQYNSLTNILTAQKFQIEQEIEILKAWIKLTDVNGLQSTIMDAPFQRLATTMSRYLGKLFGSNNLTATFYITQEANSFSFGIQDKVNGYIPFDLLSSGEKCLYTLALLLSLIESSETKLPLILIDDLLDHLDSNRIQTCFETLYNIDTVQVLLAGVVDCPHPDAKSFVVLIN